MSSPGTPSARPATRSRLPSGSHTVVAILGFAVIFSLALSLCVRHLISDINENDKSLPDAAAANGTAKTPSAAEPGNRETKTGSAATPKNGPVR